MDRKSKILSLLCIFLSLWAIAMTYQYLQLKKNPLLIKLPDSHDGGLEALEKVNFLRQFSDRFLNYDRDNFWQTQLTLTSLMAPTLQKERKSEIQRMKEVIEKKILLSKCKSYLDRTHSPIELDFKLSDHDTGKRKKRAISNLPSF